ncbi:helix-turn-helix domain-containing protein [Sphingobacterium sp. InxBP1]|uniref:helix-turn-helix domain-containing protein n=1 Tax=Sphingobacterium sp. InxBP1 TaxID=2870328 RepID=UPI002243640A|nr:helix-turn-helix transcriptional regulator [Sphingobacterium sp. InxBP1]MCW8312061.1 helix-turn-helix domain-containing protein [Sphingobacterium sp. InxBP1]
MANEEFSRALKYLRLKFKLSQETIAKIAGIIQSDYSAFERLKRKLTLDDANKISTRVWGVSYNKFVEFSKNDIDIKDLPSPTQTAIEKSTRNKLRSTENLLANELDRLISEGHLNKPTTAKYLHSQMDKKLEKRKFTEITNLLSKPPRNQMIVPLFKSSSPKIFVHKDHAEKYEKMSKDEILKLVDYKIKV